MGEYDSSETVALVEERGGEALGLQVDVADAAAVESSVDPGLSRFGRIAFLAGEPTSRSRSTPGRRGWKHQDGRFTRPTTRHSPAQGSTPSAR